MPRILRSTKKSSAQALPDGDLPKQIDEEWQKSIEQVKEGEQELDREKQKLIKTRDEHKAGKETQEGYKGQLKAEEKKLADYEKEYDKLYFTFAQ